MATMTRWVPESDPVIRRRVDKMGEEMNELGKVLHRINLQGIDGVDPAKGITNRLALTEELADVRAQIACITEDLKLDSDFMLTRVARKIKEMREWDALVDNPVSKQ